SCGSCGNRRRLSCPRPCRFRSSSSLAHARCGTDAELALAQDRVDPRDVATHGLEPPVALQLAGGRLEPQVEQLFLGLLELGDESLVVEPVELAGRQRLGPDSHQAPPSRTTKRVFIGSLCCARRMASRARSSGTPASSNITRPGLTLATHHSGEPLPEPMRVSAGFFVSGRSG